VATFRRLIKHAGGKIRQLFSIPGSMLGPSGRTFGCLDLWFPNCSLSPTSLLALLPANDLDVGISTCLPCMRAAKKLSHFFMARMPGTQVEQEPQHLFVGQLLGSVDCWFHQKVTRSLGTILPSIRFCACRGVDFLLLRGICSGSGAIFYRPWLAADYSLGNSVGAIESVIRLSVPLALSN
jgi:hypothetical protein